MNLRPPVPQTGALTRLRHAPKPATQVTSRRKFRQERFGKTSGKIDPRKITYLKSQKHTHKKATFGGTAALCTFRFSWILPAFACAKTQTGRCIVCIACLSAVERVTRRCDVAEKPTPTHCPLASFFRWFRAFAIGGLQRFDSTRSVQRSDRSVGVLPALQVSTFLERRPCGRMSDSSTGLGWCDAL